MEDANPDPGDKKAAIKYKPILFGNFSCFNFYPAGITGVNMIVYSIMLGFYLFI